MKVQLLRDMRVLHKAGEIVEVSPAEYNHFINTNSAVPYSDPVVAKPKKAKKK